MRRRRSLTMSLIVLAFLVGTVGSSSLAASVAPWSGTWKRATNEIDPGGPTVFHIRQSGIHLTGSYPWRGCTTKEGATFVGFAIGNNAVVAVKQTDGSLITQHMQLTPDGHHISGGWNVTAGTCAGSSGPFDATRVTH
jgi:hypothetical protein